MDVVRSDLFAAVLTREPGLGEIAAGFVGQHDGRTLRSREMGVAPTHQDDDGGEQIAAGRGEPILEVLADRSAAVGDAVEQSALDQLSEPARQRRPWNAEVAGELPVASHAEEGLP